MQKQISYQKQQLPSHMSRQEVKVRPEHEQLYFNEEEEEEEEDNCIFQGATGATRLKDSVQAAARRDPEGKNTNWIRNQSMIDEEPPKMSLKCWNLMAERRNRASWMPLLVAAVQA